MLYAVTALDVHEEWHDVPDIEANTPWDAFDKALAWSREQNVMPSFISVEPADKYEGVA